MWGSKNYHEFIEKYEKQSNGESVLCFVQTKGFGAFFYAESFVTRIVYLDMFEEFLMSILEEEGPEDMLLEPDGVPPYYLKEVTDFLNGKFPENWIRWGGPIAWPPRLPDRNPLYFFFWGAMPRLATTSPELAARTRFAVATVTIDLIDNVWIEIEFKYDIRRVTPGALIEHL
jgi:hypothetical protein